MSYYAVDQSGNTLGFSLKPPKWLRKAQPGKILAKVAVPLAVGAAALAIPGVGPAALSLVKGAGSLVGKGFTAFKGLIPSGTITKQIQPFMPGAATALTAVPAPSEASPVPSYSQPGIPYTTAAAEAMYPMMPQNSAMPSLPESPGATAATPASSGEMPGWVIPAAIGVGVLLLMRRR